MEGKEGAITSGSTLSPLIKASSLLFAIFVAATLAYFHPRVKKKPLLRSRMAAIPIRISARGWMLRPVRGRSRSYDRHPRPMFLPFPPDLRILRRIEQYPERGRRLASPVAIPEAPERRGVFPCIDRSTGRAPTNRQVRRSLIPVSLESSHPAHALLRVRQNSFRTPFSTRGFQRLFGHHLLQPRFLVLQSLQRTDIFRPHPLQPIPFTTETICSSGNRLVRVEPSSGTSSKVGGIPLGQMVRFFG